MFKKLVTAAAVGCLLAACGGGDVDPGEVDALDADASSGALDAGTSTRSAAAATPSSTTADGAVPGEVLVKLRNAADLPGVLSTHRLTLLSRFGARPMFRMKVVSGSVDAKVTALRADRRVLIAEPNFRAASPEARKAGVWAIGSASQYTAQWAPKAIGLPAAHALTRGAGMRVAVLDTGVDLTHPALRGRLLPGRDFVDGDNDPSEVGGASRPGWGHGTHVAGLVLLVAPSARVMPLRVLDPDGRGNVWAIAEALLHAADPDGVGASNDGAHVINLSLGTTQPTRMLDAVVELVTCSDDDEDEADDDYSDPGFRQDQERCNQHHGSVVMAAAGNGASSTERQFPAAEGAEGALAVAASNSSARIASFSNRGPWIQIAAPGQGLTSTVPGGGYGVWSGTSMATPLASGVAALVKARNPDWKPVDVTKRLTDRSAMLCGTSLRRVDAAGAVKDQVPPDIICP
jgi:subtilisin family serine protease